jgi:hypothetical protein
MIEDLAHDAFTAARSSDVAGMRAVLADILAAPPSMVATAVGLWMDRLLFAIGGGDDTDGQLNLKVTMTADDGGSDETWVPINLQAELAWVGQMFIAYAHQDIDTCRRLWSTVPAGHQFIYTERLLTTMATTTLAYEEVHAATPAGERCCAIHAWMFNDPAATGGLFAKAHLN